MKRTTSGKKKQKIAVLMTRENDAFKKMFSEKRFNDLKGIAEISTWDGKTDLKQFCTGADIILTARGTKLDTTILDTAPDLSFVVHTGGTIKSVIDRELMKKGIRVSSAAGVLGRNVAITTFGLLLVSVKKIPWWNTHIKENKAWRDNKNLLQYTDEIGGVTTGVISMSLVGKNLVSLLKNVTDNILVYDPYWTDENISKFGGKKVETLYEIAEKCEMIALCAPLLKSTEGMLDKEFFRKMKDGAVFVNASRGAILDEAALIEELEKDRIFACLDVTDPEPPAPDSPLRNLKNVSLSPHIAGIINSGLQDIGKFCIEEIKRFLNGEKLVNEVRLDKIEITA